MILKVALEVALGSDARSGAGSDAGSDASEPVVTVIATLVKEGLLDGVGETPDPRSNSTWADAAAMLHHIAQKYAAR